MNKIIIIISLTLFSISPVLSQNKQGVVTYKKIISTQTDKKFKKFKETRPKYYQRIQLIQQNLNKLLNDIEFTLLFNENESTFKVREFLDVENNAFYSLALGPYGSGKYYTNIMRGEYYCQLDAYGDKFLIKNPEIIWELSSETKQIGKYRCYKATTLKLTKGRNGIIKTPVTAWYTSELPIPFGPIGYGGLPGLIMELNIKDARFFVDKIVINSKREITIKKLKEGIKMTKDEFEEFGLKAIESYRKSH